MADTDDKEQPEFDVEKIGTLCSAFHRVAQALGANESECVSAAATVYVDVLGLMAGAIDRCECDDHDEHKALMLMSLKTNCATFGDMVMRISHANTTDEVRQIIDQQIEIQRKIVNQAMRM